MTTDDLADPIDGLAQKSQGGDSEAFRALVERLTPVLVGFFRLKEVSEAEDLAQRTWMRVVQHQGRYDRARSFRTWVFTIAHRLWIDETKKRKPKYIAMEDVADPARGDMNEAGFEERIARLRECMDELAPGQRDIIYFRYWEDLGLDAIAARLGEDYGSVKGKAYRAGQKLRKCLESKGIRKIWN